MISWTGVSCLPRVGFAQGNTTAGQHRHTARARTAPQVLGDHVHRSAVILMYGAAQIDMQAAKLSRWPGIGYRVTLC
jgi:hypothetical protein